MSPWAVLISASNAKSNMSEGRGNWLAKVRLTFKEFFHVSGFYAEKWETHELSLNLLSFEFLGIQGKWVRLGKVTWAESETDQTAGNSWTMRPSDDDCTLSLLTVKQSWPRRKGEASVIATGWHFPAITDLHSVYTVYLTSVENTLSLSAITAVRLRCRMRYECGLEWKLTHLDLLSLT